MPNDCISEVFAHLVAHPRLWDALVHARENGFPETLEQREQDALAAARDHADGQVRLLLSACRKALTKKFPEGLAGLHKGTVSVDSKWVYWRVDGGPLKGLLGEFGFSLGIHAGESGEEEPRHMIVPYLVVRSGTMEEVKRRLGGTPGVRWLPGVKDRLAVRLLPFGEVSKDANLGEIADQASGVMVKALLKVLQMAEGESG